jgi:hypothetical protein
MLISSAIEPTTFWDPLVDCRARRVTHETLLAHIAAPNCPWGNRLFMTQIKGLSGALAFLPEE